MDWKLVIPAAMLAVLTASGAGCGYVVKPTAVPLPNVQDWLTRYNNQVQLGTLSRDRGEFQDALEYFQEALEIISNGQDADPLDVSGAYDNLGDIYVRLKDYDRALPYYQEALRIRQEQPGVDPLVLAYSYNHVANAHFQIAQPYFESGAYSEALPQYEMALANLEHIQYVPHPDPGLLVDVSDDLGWMYHYQGDYSKAQTHYDRVWELLREDPGDDPQADPNVKATALNNLAAISLLLGDYDSALSYATMAQEFRPGDPQSLSALAAIFYQKQEYGKAVELAEEALAQMVALHGADHPTTAPFHNNLARLYHHIGEDPKALQHYQLALQFRERDPGPEHPDTALSLNNLGWFYLDNGQYDLASPNFKRALDIRSSLLGPGHPDTVKSQLGLATLHESMGDYGVALRWLRESLAAEDRVFTNVFETASEKQKLMFAQANQSTYHATLSLIHRHFQSDEGAVRFGLEVVLRRKSIVLDAQSQAGDILEEVLEGETLESWQRLKGFRRDYARLLLSATEGQNFQERRRTLQELETEIDQEERFLAQRVTQVDPAFALKEVSIEELANSLPEDGALVEFVRTRNWDEKTRAWTGNARYLALILTPDNRVALADLGDAEKIDDKVVKTLQEIDNTPQLGQIIGTSTVVTEDYNRKIVEYANEIDQALSDLHTMVFQPLAKHLGNRRRLILSPDGELNKVPFAALLMPDRRYLVEDYTISYVTSGRDLVLEQSEKGSGPDLFLVANPSYGAPPAPGESYLGIWFRELPNSAIEADIVQSLVPGNHQVIKQREQATESVVLSVDSPRVLHLATHGYFLKDEDLPPPDPSNLLDVFGPSRGPGPIETIPFINVPDTKLALNPMVRSFLALAGANGFRSTTGDDDGILTALEVTSMDLRQTDLVVLSACQTALGKTLNGEGVFGLRRAFALAGAENLVMSLWPVSEGLAVDQIKWFYEGVSQGQTVADAMRDSQLKTMEQVRQITRKEVGEPLPLVRLWAPFIVQQSGR